MPTNETRPAIGTAEAAVQSCVRLIASVAGQPEALVAYWLDLYWQVRNIYERENAPEPDPQVITRADLYPVLRELMQDALRSAAGDGPPRASRAGIASHENPRVALAPTVADPMDLAKAVEKAMDRRARVMDSQDTDDGPPRASRAEIASHENPRVASDSTVAEILGPQTGIKGWAKKKAAIRDRLIAARAEGMTIPQLVEASGGKLEDEDIFGILNAAKTDMDTYRRLEAALEALGR